MVLSIEYDTGGTGRLRIVGAGKARAGRACSLEHVFDAV